VPAPNKVPEGLVEHFAGLQDVPDEIRNKYYYADPQLSVEEFLKYKFSAIFSRPSHGEKNRADKTRKKCPLFLRHLS